MERYKKEYLLKSAALFCISFIVTSTLMGIYWTLYSEVVKFNDEYSSNDMENPFDACSTFSGDN